MLKLNKFLTLTTLSLSLILPLFFVVACAPKLTKWEKPGTSFDQRSYDIAECRSRSRNKVEKEEKNRNLDANSAFNSDSSLSTSMQNYDTQSRKIDLFKSCLKQKGYQRVIPGSSL